MRIVRIARPTNPYVPNFPKLELLLLLKAYSALVLPNYIPQSNPKIMAMIIKRM
jgi:hypothetical protein